MSNIDQQPKDENNKRHGQWLFYYSNGQLEYRLNYIHGIKHGLFERYFFNGEQSYRGNYNMDKEIGYWSFYGTRRHYYLCLI